MVRVMFFNNLINKLVFSIEGNNPAILLKFEQYIDRT